MLKFILLIIFLLIFNLLYSLYSLRVWKDYTEKVLLYRKLQRENLILSKKIEDFFTYKRLKRYAKRRGFKDISPEDVEFFKEFLRKGLSSEKSE